MYINSIASSSNSAYRLNPKTVNFIKQSWNNTRYWLCLRSINGFWQSHCVWTMANTLMRTWCPYLHWMQEPSLMIHWMGSSCSISFNGLDYKKYVHYMVTCMLKLIWEMDKSFSFGPSPLALWTWKWNYCWNWFV
jgi:hypothetical protein